MASVSKNSAKSYIVSNIEVAENANKGTYFEYGVLEDANIAVTEPTDKYTWKVVIS